METWQNSTNMSVSARSGFDPRLMAEAQMGAAQMANMATKTNVVKVYNDAQGANAQFPGQISSTDPQDESWALRKQLVKGSAVEGVGMAVADQSFFDYAKRKMDAQEEAAFKAWVMKNADLTNPATAQWWYSKVPWMREVRENYINYAADLQKRDALITLNGPQSEEDFRFIFLKQNLKIKIPNQPLNQLWQEDLEDPLSYKAGFFSPFAQSIRDGAMPVRYEDNKFNWSEPTNSAAGTATLGDSPFRVGGFNPLV